MSSSEWRPTIASVGNRFVTRYAYHHGYFDGVEREFRGFGMVEQWDTEEIGSVPDDQSSSAATNLDAASFVPPVHTKTWFHTGVFLGRDRVSNYFAGLIDAKDTANTTANPAGAMRTRSNSSSMTRFCRRPDAG